METYEYKIENDTVSVFFRGETFTEKIIQSPIKTLDYLRLSLYKKFPELNNNSLTCFNEYMTNVFYSSHQNKLIISHFSISLERETITNIVLDKFLNLNNSINEFEHILEALENSIPHLSNNDLLLNYGIDSNQNAEFIDNQKMKSISIKKHCYEIKSHLYANKSLTRFKSDLSHNLLKETLLVNDDHYDHTIKQNEKFFKLVEGKEFRVNKIKSNEFVVVKNFLPLDLNPNDLNLVDLNKSYTGMTIEEIFYGVNFLSHKPDLVSDEDFLKKIPDSFLEKPDSFLEKNVITVASSIIGSSITFFFIILIVVLSRG